MSERGHSRGGGGGGGGRGRGGRGGGAGNRGGAHQGSQAEKPKKENILDLNKYINKEVNVKFNGGRESKLPNRFLGELPLTKTSVVGTLKGYDQLMNLTLDDARETMRGTAPSKPFCR